MGVLQSKLFTEGDAATIKKLEDCANGQPSQPASHFRRGHAVNGRGDHVLKVQQALKNVQKNRPELGIPDFDANGVYDEKFAKAVYVYKQKRNIRNYANQIDDIIGIKTIRSLDSDNINRPAVEPPAPRPKKPNEYPRPLPNCVPEDDCPLSTEFEVTMLMGASGGEIGEASLYWFTIRDTTNNLSSLYMFKGYGAGVPTPLPFTVADGGDAKKFNTSKAVRVTHFGPAAGLAAATPYAGLQFSVSILTLQYRPDGSSGLSLLPPLTIDTGKIVIPGANIHGAHFQLLSRCGKSGGAVKRVLTRKDVILA